MDPKRPSFLPAYLDLVSKEAKETGWRAVVPYWLIGCALFGIAVAYFMPTDFWSDRRWDVSTAVYAGLLTLNGLILALGWNAFARIYDVLLRGELGAYLAKSDLLNDYIVHINFMHIVQVKAVIVAAAGLIAVLIDDVPVWIDRTVLAATAALTAYAIAQSVAALTAMNDLVWQSAYFELHKPKQGDGKVISAFGDKQA